MNKKMGKIILDTRKEQGLTQKQLATKVGVNTRDISEWERGLAKPDEEILSKIFEVLNIKNMNTNKVVKKNSQDEETKQVAYIVCVAIGLAMGVAITILNALEQINASVALSMFGIGLFCVSLALLIKNN